MKLTEAVKASQGELLHYKAKSQQLEKQVKSLLKDRGQYAELISDLKKTIPAIDAYPRVKPTKGGKTESEIAVVLKASDWQIGEVIDPNETEGFGRFDFAIAEERVFSLVTKLIDWVEMHRAAGFSIPELHIFSEGDLVSGNIHYELEVTNEFPVTVAVAKAGFLLGEMVARLAPHFDKVKVWEISADNHGRLTRKNQSKQGAKNNYSYLAHVFANQYLEKHKNVEPIMFEGVKGLADVMGKKFLMMHGHGILSTLGIPYYGLERDRAREAVKRSRTDKMFDYVSCGHYHVGAIVGGNILINGSLPGTTEFDHMCGRHATPGQVSFMVHKKHGLFNWTNWKLG